MIDSLHYNEVGQLVRKQLAPGTGLSQDVDYTYNVRGWLTGLNQDLVSGTTAVKDSKDLWGMTLSYDCGFAMSQFNGNIAGQQWRNKHDGVARAYGYDGANRLLYGDYVAQNAAGGAARFLLSGLAGGIATLPAYPARGYYRELGALGSGWSATPAVATPTGEPLSSKLTGHSIFPEWHCQVRHSKSRLLPGLSSALKYRI